jgi:hypothetical protein
LEQCVSCEKVTSGGKNMSMEAANIFGIVTRQRLAKTEQIEETVSAVMKCRVCELVIVF